MFERITEETFEEIFPLLENAFPVTELRTKEDQRALLKEAAYVLYGVRKNGVFAAVFAVWEIDAFLFIEHFAVRKEDRNGGYGGALLDALICEKGKPVVLEVEEPTDELTRRRIAFYERHGMVYNMYFYLQPPLRKENALLPLKLMTNPDGIDEETFAYYRKRLYEVVYKYTEEK